MFLFLRKKGPEAHAQFTWHHTFQHIWKSIVSFSAILTHAHLRGCGFPVCLFVCWKTLDDGIWFVL
jgi:hypothetical protein